MPQSISQDQLKAYKDQIAKGGVEAVRQVYQTLYDKGYNYAGWALGVATGNTITGQSALQFLQSTALLGLDSKTCKDLSAVQIDQIRVKMADATLDKMIEVAKREGNLSRELDYRETQEFHAQAFQASSLNINNWTLQAPMDLLGKVYGQAYVEQVWQQIRATGGDGIDAVFMSGALASAVGQVALISKDPALRTEAQAWLSQLPSVVTTVAGKLLDALSAFVPQDALIAARTLGLMVSEPVGLNLGELADGRSTTRLNDTWVVTDLGNGSRLLNWSPIDKSTPGEMVILETNGPKQKLEIPDGKGGYLQIAMSDKTTDVTSWAGVPGQSAQLKRVLTTQTDTGQNSKTYQGTALVKESTISEQTINGQASQVIDTVYYDKGQVTSQETVTLTGTMTVTQSYGPKGQLISRTEVQTYDDGSRFEYKTEGGKNYIQAIDEDGKASGWREYKPPAQEQATNAMYSDMAGFVNALRGKDKVNQLLYAAKIGINYQISQGNTQLALGAQVIKGLVSCANDNRWRKTA
jgi:hypothetical protein